jgi:TonB family protein
MPVAKAIETPPVTGPDHGAPAAETRCASCGGPSPNGEFCQPCQQAFATSWLDDAAPASAIGTSPPVANAARTQESRCPDFTTSMACARVPSDTVAAAPVAVPALLPAAAISPADDEVAVARTEIVRTDEAKASTVGRESAGPLAALRGKVRTAAAVAEPSPAADAVTRHPHVRVRPHQRRHSMALAAVCVATAAIGVGGYWLQIHEETVVIAGEGQQPRVTQNVTPARPQPPPRPRRSARPQPPANRRPAPRTVALERRKPAGAVSQGATLARPRPPASTPPAPAVPLSSRQVAFESVAGAQPEAVARAIAPPAPDVVAIARLRPDPPISPFFQTTEVTESPRVATRVELQLPVELGARPLDEMVIVRVLVSQVGHPSRISLLRRSKTGARLDNAVIAAVNQWTFAPAKKRGEAVSCWFNFGVPVGRSFEP